MNNIGTQFEIYFQMEPIDGHPLSDLDFSVEVSTDRRGSRKLYGKDDCIMLNHDSYAVPVDSAELGPGKYYLKVTLLIPNTHFIEGVRKDVSTFYSGKEIMP